MKSFKILKEQLLEKSMTQSQMKKREEIAQSMDDEDFKKRYGKDWMSVKMATATKQAMKEESKDGEHLCAKHIYSEVFGEGVVLEAEHAEPDENGNIEWYTVQFDHGKETVFTEDIKIMHAEMHGNHKKKKKMAEGEVDKAHFCATHVEHAVLGKGECISEQHAEPDEEGNIEWYTVKFDSGIQRMFTENLDIIKAESHMHAAKKKMKEQKVDEMSSKMKMKMGLYNKNEELVGNQHKIDMNNNNKIDANDFQLLRKVKKARGM